MPSISVIIPAYNHEDLIEETIHSVLSQTFTDYEIIIINDGSPDETYQRIKPFLKYENIRYFEQTNAGQASARNRGIHQARGEYIAFLDDDDIWPKDKLQWQYDYLKNSDFVAVGGTCKFLENGLKTEENRQTENEKILRFENFFNGNFFVSPGQVLIKVNALKAIGGFDPAIWGADDLDLWMRLSKDGDILKKDQLSLWYRKHSVNASRNRLKMLINSDKVLRKNTRFLNSEKKNDLLRSGYEWLYGYTGREIVIEIKQLLKRFNIHEASKLLFSFWKIFSGQIFRNRKLRKKIGMDLLPNRIRDKCDLW